MKKIRTASVDRFMTYIKGKVETGTDFIFLGSKITADGDCSHLIKRCLFLGEKAMTNLGSVLKSRDITLDITLEFQLQHQSFQSIFQD